MIRFWTSEKLEVLGRTPLDRLKEAAEVNNDASAQNDLGLEYLHGDNICRDKQKALELFQRSADQGFAAAQENLGLMYLLGVGVNKDYEKAFRYFQMANDGGYFYAKYDLGMMYIDGLGTIQNTQLGFEYIKEIANSGDSLALYRLGMLYLKGIGVQSDVKKGLHFLKLSADKGHPDAFVELGMMYLKGNYVEKDYSKARKMFTIGSDSYECTQAKYMLGTMYYKALGVKQNLKEAVYFLEECSSRGHSDASEVLARIYSAASDIKDPKLADYYDQLSREQKKHNEGVVEDYGFDIDRYTEESSKEKSRKSFLLGMITLFAVILLSIC
jgi:hypothetical protein